MIKCLICFICKNVCACASVCCNCIYEILIPSMKSMEQISSVFKTFDLDL